MWRARRRVDEPGRKVGALILELASGHTERDGPEWGKPG